MLTALQHLSEYQPRINSCTCDFFPLEIAYKIVVFESWLEMSLQLLHPIQLKFISFRTSTWNIKTLLWRYSTCDGIEYLHISNHIFSMNNVSLMYTYGNVQRGHTRTLKPQMVCVLPTNREKWAAVTLIKVILYESQCMTLCVSFIKLLKFCVGARSMWNGQAWYTTWKPLNAFVWCFQRKYPFWNLCPSHGFDYSLWWICFLKGGINSSFRKKIGGVIYVDIRSNKNWHFDGRLKKFDSCSGSVLYFIYFPCVILVANILWRSFHSFSGQCVSRTPDHWPHCDSKFHCMA